MRRGAKPPGRTALKEKLNAAIAALAEAKKFDEITANYPDLVGKMITPGGGK